MSRDNAQFLRRGYEALHRGDIESFESMSRERLDPEFSFHSHWAGRVFRGISGTQEWISDIRETWDDYDQELEEIVDLGDEVLVVGRASARGSGSGVPVTQEFAVVWTCEGERAIRARSFSSRAEALKTVASSEP
jgi:ketosteroid isomerase-like protein